METIKLLLQIIIGIAGLSPIFSFFTKKMKFSKQKKPREDLIDILNEANSLKCDNIFFDAILHERKNAIASKLMMFNCSYEKIKAILDANIHHHFSLNDIKTVYHLIKVKNGKIIKISKDNFSLYYFGFQGLVFVLLGMSFFLLPVIMGTKNELLSSLVGFVFCMFGILFFILFTIPSFTARRMIKYLKNDKEAKSDSATSDNQGKHRYLNMNF